MNEFDLWRKIYEYDPAYILRAVNAHKGLVAALEAWDRWNYEVQSAKANGESVYSHFELQAMRQHADSLARAALSAAKE